MPKRDVTEITKNYKKETGLVASSLLVCNTAFIFTAAKIMGLFVRLRVLRIFTQLVVL